MQKEKVAVYEPKILEGREKEKQRLEDYCISKGYECVIFNYSKIARNRRRHFVSIVKKLKKVDIKRIVFLDKSHIAFSPEDVLIILELILKNRINVEIINQNLYSDKNSVYEAMHLLSE